MHPYVRRLGVLSVLLLLLIPNWPYAAQNKKGESKRTEPAKALKPEPPVAWLAIRSYQRLEQRVREFTQLAKTPALADVALGIVQLQLSGLGGLDRQRALAVAVPTVDTAGSTPPVVVVLPYTDKDALLQTLRGFFPQTSEANGLLTLQGGMIPAVGRVESQQKVLVLATTKEILQQVEPTLPADLFPTTDGGPDLVLRVDVEAIKQRSQTLWQKMLQDMDRGWQDALKKATASKTTSSADKALISAYMQAIQRGMRQVVDDLSRGETRLTLAPDGLIWDMESSMRPGSPSAAFVNQQSGFIPRAAALFATGTPIRMAYALRLTEPLRQEIRTLLPLLRTSLAEKITADAQRNSAEQRAAAEQALGTYMRLIEQWAAQPAWEAAGEMQIRSTTDVALTVWAPFAEGAKSLGETLSIIDKLANIGGQTSAKMTQNALQHRDVAIHRLDIQPPEGQTQGPKHVFFAAQGEWLAVHIGDAPEPLQGLLDRAKDGGTRPGQQTEALTRIEASLASILKVSATQEQGDNPVAKALLDRILQGPDEPLTLDVFARQDTTTVRYRVPGSLVQAFAEVMGEQMTQQLRGGK